MNRRLLITTFLVALLGSACRGITPGAGSVSPAVTPPDAGPSAESPAACELGLGVAEYTYPGLREFVGEFRDLSRGVAVAEVVGVGELQYSTESGERPSCEEIEAARAVFSIGRMVEVRVLTPAGGTARKGEVLSYLLQGGSLGADSSPGHHFGLNVPSVGDRMLVLIAREPVDVDPGSGELPVEVLEMFLISPQDRVITPDRNETIPVDRVRDLLRDVLPSAAPGG